MKLTDRELQVVKMAADGLHHKDIARSLGLSVHTVKSYSQTISIKTDATSLLHAAVKLIRSGEMR